MKRTYSICLLALASMLSSPALAQAPEPQPPAPAPEQDNTNAEPQVPRFESRAERERELQFGAHPDEARLLNTLEGEVLALYLPPLTSSPKGALLLTYTGERPGDCPLAWNSLRRALPHYGWGTLLVALPPATPPAVPPRPAPPAEPAETPAEPAEPNQAADPTANNEIAPEPKAPVIPRAQRIASRLQAAVLQLEQEGQLNLVVMVDNLSAAQAIAHLKPGLKVAEGNQGGQDTQGQSPLAGPVRALILANIHPHAPLSNQDLAQTFSMAELPVLDLFLVPNSTAESRRHKGQSQRQKMSDYQALTLPYPQALSAGDFQSFWIKRLEGFMSRQAKGREERFGPGRPL